MIVSHTFFSYSRPTFLSFNQDLWKIDKPCVSDGTPTALEDSDQDW